MAEAFRELLARFGVEVDTSNLKKGNQEVDNFSNKLQKIGEMVTGAFVLRGAAGFVKRVFDEGNALYTAARRAGTTVEAYQSLTYAGEMLNVSMEKVGVGFKYLQRNLAIAASGGEEMKKTFEKLGVTIEQGVPIDSEQAFLQIAESIKNLGDKEMQTAVAMRIFGRAGYDLLPMLKAGEEELKKYYASVKALGGGLSTDLAEKIDTLDDQMNDQRLMMFSVRLAILQQLLPSLLSLSKTVVEAGQAFVDWNKHGEAARVTIVGTLLAIASAATPLLSLLMKFALPFAKFLAFALILEDLYVWFKGGQSVAGLLFDTIDTGISKSAAIFGESVGWMFSSFDNFVTGIKVAWMSVGYLIGSVMISATNAVGEALAWIADAWNSTIASLPLPSWAKGAMQVGDTEETTGRTNLEGARQRGAKTQSDWTTEFETDADVAKYREGMKKMRAARAEEKLKAEQEDLAKKYGGAPSDYSQKSLSEDSMTPGVRRWMNDMQRKEETNQLAKRFGGEGKDYWKQDAAPTAGMLEALKDLSSSTQDKERAKQAQKLRDSDSPLTQKQVLKVLGATPATSEMKPIDTTPRQVVAGLTGDQLARKQVALNGPVSNVKTLTDNSTKTVNVTVSRADKKAFDNIGRWASDGLRGKMDREFDAPTFESED